jgi:hypothetical protein
MMVARQKKEPAKTAKAEAFKAGGSGGTSGHANPQLKGLEGIHGGVQVRPLQAVVVQQGVAHAAMQLPC